MPCYRPNLMLFNTSVKPYIKHKFVSANTPDFKGYEWFEKINEDYKKHNPYMKWIKVGCGQCAGCQEKTSKEWACRCMLEAELYKENYFLTLTYDDMHVPCESEIINKRTGEIFEDPGDWLTGHLRDKDVQDFLKRLRITWKRHYNHEGIRTFYCGEYGQDTERPHYHMILFNFPIKPEDLKIYRVNKDGSIYYTCKKIEEIWGQGFITIGEVNWDTCAYTARYVMKKLKVRKNEEEQYKNGQTPEFIHMSNRPGIAREAFDKNLFKNDEIILKGHKQHIQPAKPPRYYDKIYDVINPEHMEKIRERRQRLAENNLRNKMLYTDLTIQEQLKMEEEQKLKVWKSLKRNKV